MIHMTAGPRLLRASRKVAPCEPGEAKITRGYRLPARYVIHTVGPRWRGGDHDEARILESAYRSSMRLAMEYRLRSIAFPAISCGVYGFPDEIAARIAVDTVRSHLSEAPRLRRVLFVCYEDEALEAYREALTGQGIGGNQATG